jgi:hypothetical protein
MKGQAETGGDCGDQDERTGKKLKVQETSMKGQAKREMFAKTSLNGHWTGRKPEVPEPRIKGQADRAKLRN